MVVVVVVGYSTTATIVIVRGAPSAGLLITKEAPRAQRTI